MSSFLQMSGLFGVVSLRRLNLSGNRIQHIPKDIKALKDLETLRLARNKVWI